MEKLECVFCAKTFPLDIFFPYHEAAIDGLEKTFDSVL